MSDKKEPNASESTVPKDKKDKPLKRGKLSNGEMLFIRQNCFDMEIPEIAASLGRTEAPIRKFLDKENLHASSFTDDEIILQDLRNMPFYHSLKQQFDGPEMLKFEHEWTGYYEQFSRDVTHTEANQIKDAIRIEILLDRCLTERKAMEQGLEDAKEYLDTLKLELQNVSGDDRRELMRDIKEQAQLVFSLESGRAGYITEYKELLTKKEKFAQQLKSTREQRKKNAEDAKTNFNAWLRELGSEEVREKIGFDMEVNRIASYKAEIELEKLHTYVDGNVDQPLLNSETFIEEEH